MDLFSIVIVGLVATGGVLVLGGIFLIASGALKLAGDKDGKTDIKIGEFFQLGTTVPGLGIFVLGLAFQSIGLFYANQQRKEVLAEEVQEALQKERDGHALHLAGIVRTSADQNARLTICMGQTLEIPSNNPFTETVGPYLDFVVVSLETDGAKPEQFTVSQSANLPASWKTFSHLVLPQNGIVDVGTVQLQQVVDLTPAIHSRRLIVSGSAAPQPAGSAYR